MNDTKKIKLLADTTNPGGLIDKKDARVVLPAGTVLDVDGEIPTALARLISLDVAEIEGDAADPEPPARDAIDLVLDLNAENAIKSIGDDTTAEVLLQLQEREAAGKNRKTVLAHIEELQAKPDPAAE